MSYPRPTVPEKYSSIDDIHSQNLANFEIVLEGSHDGLRKGRSLTATIGGRSRQRLGRVP